MKKKVRNKSEKSGKTLFLKVAGEGLGVFLDQQTAPKKYYSRELTTFSEKKLHQIKFRIEGSIRNKKTSRIRAKLN